MKNFNDRPEFITSDNLWHLYECIRNMNTPYIKVKLAKDDKEYLYVIEDLTFDADEEAKYTFDDMANMEIPYEQNEYLVLHLRRLMCNEPIARNLRVWVNVYSRHDVEMTAADLWNWCGLAVPSETELNEADLVKDVPVTYIEEEPIHRNRPFRRNYDFNNRLDNLRTRLDSMDIWYAIDNDNGVKRIKMAFEAPNCPGSRTESCIRFLDSCAEVTCSYSEAGSEIFRKSAHKHELLRLLNFINARVHLDQKDDYYEPQIFLEPRFCVTGDSGCGITAITMINYKLWDKLYEFNTNEYIIGYCPSLLSLLEPFIFGVLEGKMTVDEAIEGIKKDVLKEE